MNSVMKTHVPMLTINKLTTPLDSIRWYSKTDTMTADAKLGMIYVAANETLKETAPEIDTIMREAS
jgi:hypothetical protein